ncbi:MAG: terpene cyclase/mutase family protein [Planctomycetes bacterium]|nr:terpene cyclase/mutase family protein [Planctomycetota bacterium]
MLLSCVLLAVVGALAPQGQEPAPAASDRDVAWATPAQDERAAAAVARGLRWLADEQSPAGCWTGHVGHKQMDDYVLLPQALSVDGQRRHGHGHLGVSALCGLAFLAGGHLPDRGPYAATVARTLDYVVGCGLENGFLTDAGTRMYSHAFATLFLAEVEGMAATPTARVALERAVNLIVDCQNAHGGWRYNPFDRDSDLSVTVCQLQALRAARNIGIRVPIGTVERALAYVRQSRVERGPTRGLFYYKIHGRGAYQKDQEYAINAAALTALTSGGIHDDDLADPVLDFLQRGYAQVAAPHTRSHYYFWYGNYYAAQAFYQHGGSRWRQFFARLADDLVASQRPDGRWRNDVGPGDAFATAVACLLLQLPKQYLPILQR